MGVDRATGVGFGEGVGLSVGNPLGVTDSGEFVAVVESCFRRPGMTIPAPKAAPIRTIAQPTTAIAFQ